MLSRMWKNWNYSLNEWIMPQIQLSSWKVELETIQLNFYSEKNLHAYIAGRYIKE